MPQKRKHREIDNPIIDLEVKYRDLSSSSIYSSTTTTTSNSTTSSSSSSSSSYTEAKTRSSSTVNQCVDKRKKGNNVKPVFIVIAGSFGQLTQDRPGQHIYTYNFPLSLSLSLYLYVYLYLYLYLSLMYESSYVTYR